MELTKRDYFAAQALTGLLARSPNAPSSPFSRAQLAAEAFEYADEMLKLSKTLMDPVRIDPDEMIQIEQKAALKEKN
jgi:hypothetical protein